MIKDFNKSNLKAGMLVEYRNGDLRLVVPYGEDGKFYLVGENGEGSLNNYNDELLYPLADWLDIIKVYSQTKYLYQYMNISTKDRELLWERKDNEKIRKENIKKKNEMLAQREQLLKELKDKEHQLEILDESYFKFMEENFKDDAEYYIPEDMTCFAWKQDLKGFNDEIINKMFRNVIRSL